MNRPDSPRRADAGHERFWSPKFITATVLLGLAALGLHPALALLESRFSKQPIDLVQPFGLFDTYGLPSFRFVPDNTGFHHVSQDPDVGTDDWRTMAFAPRGGGEAGEPHPNVMLLLTYYSDPRDQVPHTPEVCYRQIGAEVREISKVEFPAPELGRDATIPARVLDMRHGGRDFMIVYTFCCNGRFYEDREKVRWAIGVPGDRYVYFSKVEVVCALDRPEDRAAVLKRCQQLLRESLALLLERHYPKTSP